MVHRPKAPARGLFFGCDFAARIQVQSRFLDSVDVCVVNTQTILAVDTSETACSVALWHQQQTTQLIEPAARKHSDCLLPMIDALLTAEQLTLSQIDCIAFARGPGAFTGLRLGAALVQGFSYALAIPVIAVSTLLAQAYAGYRQLNISSVVSALDARMGEIYVAAYEFAPQHFSTILPEQVIVPSQLRWQVNQPWCGVGSGWCYADALAHLGQPAVIASDLHCSASHVLACALDFNLPAKTDHDALLPSYVRQQVVS
jgi:tRNA threonylcarbamoyladenosine biosynthesis protein TsaB